MNLINAFESGAVEGIRGKPEKVIETWQSKIFFFGRDVYKVYNHKKNQFVDLSSKKVRHSFYKEDFSWNNFMSPSIYLALQPVKEFDGGWVKVTEDEADDFYIKMARVDENQGINDKMMAGKMMSREIEMVAKVMTEKLEMLNQQKEDGLSDIFSLGWKELFARRIEDARTFGYSASRFIPKNQTDEIIGLFQKAVGKDTYFKKFSEDRLQVAIDNHSDNIIIQDNNVVFVDVYLQKRSWRVVDKNFNISRLAADVAVLAGRKAADVLYCAYAKIHQEVPPSTSLLYEAYNAFLKSAYLFLTDKEALARKYRVFLLERCSLISKNYGFNGKRKRVIRRRGKSSGERVAAKRGEDFSRPPRRQRL